MRLPRSRPRRPGFTLIELLAIIFIIVTIIGLTAGAYFRVRASQIESATRTTVQKLQKEYDAQTRAVLDNAQEDVRHEKVPTIIANLANNENPRTKVIWTKFKMKLEFPQNTWEALVWPVRNGLVTLEPKPTYARALSGFVPRDPSTMTAADLMLESAAMFYLAMTQPRRGVAGFDPSLHLGSQALGKVTLTDANGQTRQFDCFKDNWGQPIFFIRWPFNGQASDLNQANSPYYAKNAAGQPIDPQDPEKTLHNAGWYNSPARPAFSNALGHPLPDPTRPYNLTSVIISMGPNRKLGLDAYFARQGADEDDNIYGYRSRGVGER